MSKSFGGAVALRGADLTASYGQVLGVLGENGAGKSTLMKVLAGAVRPDRGRVQVNGSPLRLGDPLASEAAGIGAVFQELTVIPDLTVAQNIFLRREPRRGGLISLRKLAEATERLFEELSVTGISPMQRGRDLSLAQKQIIEIVKVTSQRPSIVILDEPTSALGEEQVLWLFNQVRTWRAEGRCVAADHPSLRRGQGNGRRPGCVQGWPLGRDLPGRGGRRRRGDAGDVRARRSTG